MSVMRDFLGSGFLHWQLNGETPCGARLAETVKTNMWHAALTALGYREPAPLPEPFDQILDCPICIPTKRAYLKMLRNGGTMQGWRIRPNEDRSAARLGPAAGEVKP